MDFRFIFQAYVSGLVCKCEISSFRCQVSYCKFGILGVLISSSDSQDGSNVQLPGVTGASGQIVSRGSGEGH